MTRWLLLTAFVVSLYSIKASASGGFECTIKDSASPNSLGELVEDKVYKSFQDRKFTVDRETGRMVGALKNHEYYGVPKILNVGSRKKAFRVITVYKPSVNFEYLTIETYKDVQQLPFLFVSSSTVISGTCTKY